MKKIILIACATSLAGCVSVESVEQREPLFVAETTKSAKVYATVSMNDGRTPLHTRSYFHDRMAVTGYGITARTSSM